MDVKREQLVPSADLADFYKEKLSLGLRIVYLGWLEADNNYNALRTINAELHQIYKQIKNRLKKFEYEPLIKNYEECDKSIRLLTPFIRNISMDKETGERKEKVIRTKHFNEYRKRTEEKEVIIYECLDSLGLFGAVKYEAKRLR